MKPKPTSGDRAVALDMLPEDRQDAISVHLTACLVRDRRLAGEASAALASMVAIRGRWESERWG